MHPWCSMSLGECRVGGVGVSQRFIHPGLFRKINFFDERVKHGWRIGLQSVSLGLPVYLLYRVPTGTGMIWTGMLQKCFEDLLAKRSETLMLLIGRWSRRYLQSLRIRDAFSSYETPHPNWDQDDHRWGHSERCNWVLNKKQRGLLPPQIPRLSTEKLKLEHHSPW